MHSGARILFQDISFGNDFNFRLQPCTTFQQAILLRVYGGVGFWSSLPFMAIQEAVHSGDFLATYLVHDNVTGHAWITKHMERCVYEKRPHHKSCRWAWNSARNPLQALGALPQDEALTLPLRQQSLLGLTSSTL
jgi:hypothetical protein